MVFTFKIRLQEISKPPVWRRVQVPAQFTFERMHRVIQAAFGWSDYHLYSFSPRGYKSDFQIMPPGDESFFATIDPEKHKLAEFFKEEKQTFYYEYDFGDSWMHHMTLEKITPDKASRALCTAGKGKCPPEDCGGPWGYASFLEAVSDPKHPEYESLRRWADLEPGDRWNPAEFELEWTNGQVSSV